MKKINFLLIMSAFMFVACSDDDNDVDAVVNIAPQVVDITAAITVADNSSVDITLVGTDSDGDVLTFSVVSQPSQGSVDISGNKATYTPSDNADGEDSFTYKANDGALDSNVATVTIDVTGNFVLSGEISSDRTLTADKIWTIKGRVFVGDGATLTIPAGTILKAEGGTGTNASFLAVARGGKLIANGTADKPIIMTSVSDDIKVGESVGSNLNVDNRGLWGGLLVLGKAPSSFKGDVSEYQIEGIPADDKRGLYGGSDASDNSGSMKYISIRHGGAEIGADNEINGLTLGGVGSGTVIDNIEVVGNVDDGIEFFGGTVNASNLLVWGQGDDGLDIDQAYSGTVENAMVIATAASDHGMEIDGPEGSAKGKFTLKKITSVGSSSAADGEYNDNRKGATGTIDGLVAFGFQAGKDFELDADADSKTYTDGDLVFKNFQVDVPDGASLTGGDIFNDKSSTPNANYEDGKTIGGASFVTNVAKASQTGGADVSVWAWSMAKARGADGL